MYLSIRSANSKTVYNSYSSIIRENNITYLSTPTCNQKPFIVIIYSQAVSSKIEKNRMNLHDTRGVEAQHPIGMIPGDESG
jgi:hypothetical protein